MAAKSNTEQIQEITADLRNIAGRLEVHIAVTTRELEDHSEELSSSTNATERVIADLRAASERLILIDQRCSQFERFNPERVTVLEQRIASLEKLLEEGRTRRWQVWLAFVGAFLTASIALIVAFLKK